MGWVSIGVTIFVTASGYVFWLIRRRVSRIDALELAVFGDGGVRERLHKYVTHEALDRKLNELNGHMKGISEEGQRREDRIIEAIDNQTTVVGAEVREIKNDLRAQASRIDEAIRIAHQNGR